MRKNPSKSFHIDPKSLKSLPRTGKIPQHSETTGKMSKIPQESAASLINLLKTGPKNE